MVQNAILTTEYAEKQESGVASVDVKGILVQNELSEHCSRMWIGWSCLTSSSCQLYPLQVS